MRADTRAVFKSALLALRPFPIVGAWRAIARRQFEPAPLQFVGKGHQFVDVTMNNQGMVYSPKDIEQAIIFLGKSEGFHAHFVIGRHAASPRCGRVTIDTTMALVDAESSAGAE